jgi:hypothetical protein
MIENNCTRRSLKVIILGRQFGEVLEYFLKKVFAILLIGRLSKTLATQILSLGNDSQLVIS